MERNVNSDRSKCIMAGLGHYELTLLESNLWNESKNVVR